MTTDTTRQPVPPATLAHGYDASFADAPDETLAHEQAVDAILDDCFLSIGQGIGLRASLDYDAVVHVRNNFRPKFLAAMRRFGNRWLEDRTTVTAVGWMLGERAVRYAEGAPSIGRDAMIKACADVERYCQLHAARRSGARGRPATEAATAMIAGYWCTWEPKE
ncbi:MAG: hypothetical protein KA371_03690 [Acidobacteria bacterium]|nr:hypothetical protein [Acidobacteriota bacterium]